MQSCCAMLTVIGLRSPSEFHVRLKIPHKALSVLWGMAMIIVIPVISAQTMPTPVTHTPPPVAQALTREDIPPSAPQVSWDGSQLTIITNNSTLSDILEAVRAHTGAEIDMPEIAARQRMAAKLGPGPIRDVISSLLSWTDFNYIIQAVDGDPDRIQSILLIPRPKDAIQLAATRPARGAGYRQDSDANPNLAETEDPQANPVSAQAVATELPPPTEPAVAPVAPPIAGADPAPTIADLQPSIANSQTSAPVPESSSGTGQTRVPAQMIEQLQSMYQQRLQLQESQKPHTDYAP